MIGNRTLLIIVVALLCFATAVIGIAIAAKPAVGADVDPSCLTKTQAALRYPNQWLYWHTPKRCWDNRHSWSAIPSTKSRKSDRMPDQIPLVERPKGIPIAYPDLMQGIGTSDNMLRPEPLTGWPLVIDFDVDPPLFIPWQQRVVSSLPAAGGGPE
jgi:hypothetical protein